MSSPRPRLILIDGSSYLFRAFHALPPLTNAAGEPTGALFGVVNMLRSTLKARPEYVAFVSDAPGPTFRDALYPEYKANRSATPDDLRVQIDPMLAIVAALGFPILRVAGVEADDVIGTLARQAEALDLEVLISTSDKDFAQLVSPHISLFNTMTNTTSDSEAVQAKFGVPPDRIIDFLSLTGDTIDNIPGVPGCGPKTAAKWLAEHGSLDAIMANAASIGGKVGQNLRDALPGLPLSRQLATIKTDVELDVGPLDLAMHEPDTETLRTLYKRYEFNAALKDLDAHAPVDAPTTSPASPAPAPVLSKDPGPVNYELIVASGHLDQWLQRLQSAELAALAVTSSSEDPMQAELVGIAVALETGHAGYIPLAHDYAGAPDQMPRDAVLAALKPWLEDPQQPKLVHGAKFAINLLAHAGIVAQGFVHDTMLESYIWNSTDSRHDLVTLAKRYLGIDMLVYADVAGKGAKQISFAQVDLTTACRYAAEVADMTLRVHQSLQAQWPAASRQYAVYRDIEIPLLATLARMEQRGVLIDVPALQQQTQQLGRRMVELTEQAHQLGGRVFSLDSPKQLQAILFDELALPCLVKTPKGQPSTNEEALEAIASQHPLPRVLLEYRGLAKLRSTYTDKLPQMVDPATGRVHTNYQQAVAATGRLSSIDPNLQNIPIRTEEGRRIRKAFIAPPGWRVMAADYSQIELRIMAHLSGDAGLLAAFHDGLDVHRATAAEVFDVALDLVDSNQRRAAKAINFGLMYGMSAFGLARQLDVGRNEAQEYMARYFSRYPGVRDFMENIRAQAHRDGFVETVSGRRLYLDAINSRNGQQRAGAERAAINAPMQGTAADIIKRAMNTIDSWLLPLAGQARMLMQVHDELVFEVHEDHVDATRDGIRERMVAAAELSVPLVVDIGVGDNWDEAH